MIQYFYITSNMWHNFSITFWSLVILLKLLPICNNQTEETLSTLNQDANESSSVSVSVTSSNLESETLSPSFSYNKVAISVTQNLTSVPVPTSVLQSDNITHETVNISNIEASMISPSPILSSMTTEATEMTPSFVSSRFESKSCGCDLTMGACDINCCCDIECSPEEKSSFSHCKRATELENEWYCYNHPNIYKSNTHFKRSKFSDGMFCIVRDNLVKKKVYQEPEVMDTLSKFRRVESRLGYSWLDKFNHAAPPLKKKLQVGDPLLVVKAWNETVIDVWNIPAQLFSTGCETLTPVTYLRNVQSHCLKQLQEFKDECTWRTDLNAQNHFQNLYLIKLPILTWTVNTTMYGNSSGFSDASETVCENIGGCILITLTSCHYKEQKNTAEEQSCIQNQSVPSTQLSADGSVCQNIISEVHYIVVHDGVKGIVDATVSVVLSNVSQDNPYFKFTTTVSFQSWRQNNSTYRRSGNPGYQIGEAVLAKHQFTEMSKEDVQPPETDLNETSGNYLTIIRHMHDGTCSLVKPLRKNVKFGINQQSGCMLKYDFRASSDCQDFQKQILGLLLGDTPVNYVGMFGNASPHNPSDWVKIIVKGEPKLNLQSLRNGVCSTIVNGFHIQIAFAKVDSLKNPQLKILGVKIKYFQPIEVSAKCVGPYCTDSMSVVEIEVISTVSFVDITNPAITLYAPPPVIHAKLPYDFFYPFLSHAPTIKCHFLLLVCLNIVIVSF